MSFNPSVGILCFRTLQYPGERYTKSKFQSLGRDSVFSDWESPY